MVQIYGFAQGFGDGMQVGNEAADRRLKRDALMKEQINEKVKMAEASANEILKGAQTFISNAPNRTHPTFNSAVGAYRQPIEETAAMLEQLGDPDATAAAQRLRTNTNLVFSHTKTKSEAFTAEVDSKMESITGKPSQGQPAPQQGVEVGVPKMEPSQAPQQPQPVQTPDPVPQASMSGPGAGLTQQAQAQPMQPPVPPPAVSAPTPAAPAGPRSWVDIPMEDVELLLADPTAAQEFQAEYGQDPSVLLKDPDEPTQSLSEQEMRMHISGVDPFTPERKEMAKSKAKSFGERKTKISDAKATLLSNHEARKKLDAGMFTGLGSDWKLWAARAKLAVSDDPELQAKVKNTEAYMAPITAQVGRLIKMFGAGTGLSDTDREMAYKAAGGDLSLNEESLREILNINSKMALWIMQNPDAALPMDEAALKAEQERYGVEF